MPINFLTLTVASMTMSDDREKLLQEFGDFIYTFLKNVNETKDMRFLSIIMHQYMEYYIDNVIKSGFKNPDEILNEHRFFGFYEKCKLLKALGIFDEDDGKNLLINIRIINSIRNFYAHNLLDLSSDETIPPKIKDKINSMHKFGEIAFKEDDSYLFKFKEICISTIAELSRIPSKIESNKITC